MSGSEARLLGMGGGGEGGGGEKEKENAFKLDGPSCEAWHIKGI